MTELLFRALTMKGMREVSDDGHFVGHSNVFGVVDSYGTVFDKGCFTKTIKEHDGEFPVLWFHDPREPLCLAAHTEDDKGLRVEGHLDLSIDLGRRIRSGMVAGYIDCMSIGFRVVKDVTEDEELHFKEVGLWESSLLTRNFAATPGADVDYVRALPDLVARINAIGQGAAAAELGAAVADLRVLLDETFDRGVNGAANLPLAPLDRPWDKAKAEKRVRKLTGADDEPNAKYRRAWFWFDSEEPEEFGSYKLLFADVIDGELKAIPRAIFAVAAVLMGARGGVDIPAADKEGVKRRVERYYAKMRKEFDDDDIIPPWKRSSQIEVVHAISGALRDLGPALTITPEPSMDTSADGEPQTNAGEPGDHSLVDGLRDLAKGMREAL